MTLNLDTSILLQTQAHIQAAREAFGDAGGEALRTLLDSVRQVLRAHPPELITAPLTIVAPVTISLPTSLTQFGPFSSFSDAQSLAAVIAAAPGQPWLIAIAADRSFRLVTLSGAFDYMALAGDAVVYHREDEVEHIVSGTKDNVVLKVSTISASAFADPTFTNLDEALDHYGQRISETACEVLKPVWEGGVDGPRLVLKNKPEHLMRDSLFHALSLVLRRADVTREHVLDSTKPVDIKVSWPQSTAEALIEVKWIGRSMAGPGSKNPYFDFPASRAQEGADQLANYLDIKKSSAAKNTVLGYLVVFDARRKSVKGPNDGLSKENATFYRSENIAFNPDHMAIRSDFKQPRRWFMEPRQSHFLEAA